MATDQILSVCTGIGGLDIGFDEGLRYIGGEPRTVCMVEREAFCVSILAKQIEEGRMDSAPIWCGDLQDLPTEELPRIDWIIGGYPCQPFSNAGSRLGEDDPRHLWPIIRKQIDTLRPSGVFFENVSGHLTLGLRSVLRDLGERGFVCAFGLFTAEEVGAPHRRERVFILGMADSNSERLRSRHEKQRRGSDQSESSSDVGAQSPIVADTSFKRGQRSEHELEIAFGNGQGGKDTTTDCEADYRWPSRPSEQQHDGEPARTLEPRMGRDADGLPDRVDRIRSLGNAVVIPQARKALIMLMEEILEC